MVAVERVILHTVQHVMSKMGYAIYRILALGEDRATEC